VAWDRSIFRRKLGSSAFLKNGRKTARLPELLKQHRDRMPDFGIGVEDHMPFLVVDEPHRKGASQLTLFGLVDFATLEATAQEVAAGGLVMGSSASLLSFSPGM